MFYSFAKVTNSYVPFADNIGEKVYMQEFDGKLPDYLSRWQPTVDAMLNEITLGGPQYIMIDQGFVNKGQTLRRPGLHVDGFWEPKLFGHRRPGGHGHQRPGRNGPGHGGGGHIKFNNRTELILLASDVSGCVYHEGEWDGEIDEQHAVTNVVGSTKIKQMLPHHSYAADTGSFLHESIPQQTSSWRTVVRLNCYNAH